ncbi:MAG: DUF11 domain-containing protein [Planctomycetes bacterium]|nr:DUF11 domain-containing protein [Planctomycetota bacterium]
MKCFEWTILILVVLALFSCKKEIPKEPQDQSVSMQPNDQVPSSPTQNNNPSVDTTARPDEPQVSVIKDGPEEVRLGQNAAYILTVVNTGKSIVKDVVLLDKIPAGMKYNDITGGTVLRWDLGDLLPDETRKITYMLGTIGTGIFTSQAELYINREFKYQLCFTIKVVAPELKLSIGGERICYLNKAISYTITINNNGDGSAKEIQIVYTVPDFLEYIESSPRGVFNPKKDDFPASVTWRLDNIAPKAKTELFLKLRGKNLGRVVNSVKLSSFSSEPPTIASLEATASLIISPVPEMKISQYDTDDPLNVGYQTTYVIEMRNEGTSAFTNIILKSKIPPEMEFSNADGPSGYKLDNITGEVVFETIPILAVGDKLVYKITCKAIKAGLARHVATVIYDQFRASFTDEEETNCYE